MNKRLPILALAALMIAPLFGHLQTTQAQDPDATWYLRPRAGTSWYWGDNDKAQLGPGATGGSSVPVELPDPSNI